MIGGVKTRSGLSVVDLTFFAVERLYFVSTAFIKDAAIWMGEF